MKRFTALFLAFISIVLMSSCGKTDIEQKPDTTQAVISADENSEYATKAENIQYDEKSGLVYVDNEIIVSAADGVTSEQINELVENYGGKVVSGIESINEYQISFDSVYSFEEIQNIISEVNKSELVDESDENIVIPCTLNTDIENSEWADEWNIEWTDDWIPQNIIENHQEKDFLKLYKPDKLTWGLNAINCADAWKYKDQMKKVNVGVYDSEFFNHSDLSFSGLYKNNFDFNNSSEEDFHNSIHGTHVAGTIAATFDKNGVCGVAPNVNLYAASLLGMDENSLSWDYISKTWVEYWNDSDSMAVTSYLFKSGIDELINKYNCKVINLSMGMPKSIQTEAKSGNKKAQRIISKSNETMEKFLSKQLKNNDFIICQSAGNEGRDNIDAKFNGFFCGITDEKLKSHIIIVGSMYKKYGKNALYEGSQLGKIVDTVAPGVSICSTITEDGKTSSYWAFTGTSMACPHVAGVAAMVWGANPSLTGTEVKKIVCSSTDEKIGGYPMLNAKLAVEKAFNPSAEPAENKGTATKSTVSKTGSKQTVKSDWETAAVDAIYNFYNYDSVEWNDGFHFFLVDIDSDSVPEIFEGSHGGTAPFWLSKILYWNGEKYVKGFINTESSDIQDITPYINKETSEIEFWENVLPKDLDENTSKIYYYRKCNRIKFKNGVVNCDKTLDRSQYTEILNNRSSYSSEEVDEALDILKQEKNSFFEKYSFSSNTKYSFMSFRSMYLINEGESIQSYHKTVSKEDAERIVNNYINNSASGHFQKYGEYGLVF